MRFGLPSFLGRFLKSPQQTKQKHRAGSRSRKLFAEPLETRFALSTLVGGVVVPEDVVVSSEPVTALVASPSAVDPPPTNPLGNPPGSNTPPVIHDLTCTLEGNWYVVRGWVSDNVDPTGYTVQLSGVITGSAVVGVDDHFSYLLPFNPQLHGSIFAQTQDLPGLLSNEATASF